MARPLLSCKAAGNVYALTLPVDIDISNKMSKKIFQCNPTRFLAKTVEPLVWNDVVQSLSNENLAAELIQKAGVVHESKTLVTENDKLRRKLRGVEDQLDALAEHLSKIPKTVSPTGC